MASGVKIQSEFPGGNCFHAGNAKLRLEPRCNSFELSLVCVLCHWIINDQVNDRVCE